MPKSNTAREFAHEFDPDDVTDDLSEEVSAAMLRLILSWASMDSAITVWLCGAFELRLDLGSILIENMDISSKIGRLKKLYQHYDVKYLVDKLSRLKKDFDKHKNVRNTIAHAPIIGTSKSKPGRVVFSPVRAFIGQLDNTTISYIHIRQINAAADFARNTSADAIATYEHLKRQPTLVAELARLQGQTPSLQPNSNKTRQRRPAS